MEIIILYTCDLCGLEKQKLSIPQRRENEDIREWMRKSSIHIQSDHLKRSPDCKAEALSQLMIPITGAEMIGGPSIS